MPAAWSGSLLVAKRRHCDAGRLRGDWPRNLSFGMLGTVAAVLVWLVAMTYVVSATSLWHIAARIGLTLLSLLPVGLFMGIPFATGLRYLQDNHPRFIPWAWGINGLTSVMASILAIVLAMRFGFVSVVVLGSAIYALGFLAMRLHFRGGGALSPDLAPEVP